MMDLTQLLAQLASFPELKDSIQEHLRLKLEYENLYVRSQILEAKRSMEQAPAKEKNQPVEEKF